MTNYEECIINLKAFVKKGCKKTRLVHDDDKHVLHIIKFTLSSLRQLLLWFGALYVKLNSRKKLSNFKVDITTKLHKAPVNLWELC